MLQEWLDILEYSNSKYSPKAKDFFGCDGDENYPNHQTLCWRRQYKPATAMLVLLLIV